ncbi:MAG: response regulator transcription factor [Thermoflexales bacterium]|nr:response regulator transcription factor [Thermoflexales bacterium]
MVRVLLLGRDCLLQKGLLSVLAGVPDVEVVSGTDEDADARRLMAEVQPDVVVLGWGMSLGRWVARVRRIRAEYPEVGVLVLTPRNRAYYLAWAVRAGATGMLTAEEAPEWLVEAVRRAAKGESFYTPEQMERSRVWWEEVGRRWESLSRREREVVGAMVQGRSNREIAVMLGVTEKTVEKHVTGVLGKLGVKSRAEAIRWVLESGVWEAEGGDKEVHTERF